MFLFPFHNIVILVRCHLTVSVDLGHLHLPCIRMLSSLDHVTCAFILSTQCNRFCITIVTGRSPYRLAKEIILKVYLIQHCTICTDYSFYHFYFSILCIFIYLDLFIFKSNSSYSVHSTYCFVVYLYF